MKGTVSNSRLGARQPELAFTLVELVVILAVISALIALHLPALAKAERGTKITQCASNLRQFTAATIACAYENGDRLPDLTGTWAWDTPASWVDEVVRCGARWQTMFCPGTAPRFTEADNLLLFNFTPGIRIIGYATTFPGTSNLNATNQNPNLTPQSISVAPGQFFTPLPSERVLLADVTLSQGGQGNEALRDTYNYTSIQGGLMLKPFVSAHLTGRLPLGGNLGMLDGHVEWRKFLNMHPRTGGTAPVFWW